MCTLQKKSSKRISAFHAVQILDNSGAFSVWPNITPEKSLHCGVMMGHRPNFTPVLAKLYPKLWGNDEPLNFYQFSLKKRLSAPKTSCQLSKIPLKKQEGRLRNTDKEFLNGVDWTFLVFLKNEIKYKERKFRKRGHLCGILLLAIRSRPFTYNYTELASLICLYSL